MSGLMLWTLIVAAAVIVAAIFLASLYNRLVTLRQRTLNAFSQIDVQLKRRHDLIPNLVETVKGYMAHERQTLEAVTQARADAVGAAGSAAANPRDASAVLGAAAAENALVAALSRLLVLSENYPQLKADRNVGRLMEELSSTENRVAFARQAYNDAVMQYNTATQQFPATLFAGMFGFREAPLFQIDSPTQREAVAVSFS
jgi:LemA protein